MGEPIVDLVILATSDLHGALDGGPGGGLSALAPMIRAARDVGAIYLDNGDLFPEAAGMPEGAAAMVAALDALGCAAAGPGNHDFDFGLAVLERAFEGAGGGAGVPLVCANATRGGGRPLFARWRMVERRLPDRAGRMQTLRVGVSAVVPPQTAAWNGRVLKGAVQIGAMEAAARAVVGEMRAAGADVTVLLAHSGFGTGSDATPDNRVEALADTPGLDVVIAGHTHRPFPLTPGPERAGALVVNPGAQGRWLGRVDLAVSPGRGGPRAGRVQLLPAGRARDAEIAALAEPVAARMAARLDRKVGHTGVPLTSHFALIHEDAPTRLVNAAKADFVTRALAGTRWEGWPVLAATAPFRAGGRGGARNYVDIPAGPLRRRDIETLYGFPNTVVALESTGAGVRRWLERAAGLYRRLAPGGGVQPLFDPGVAGHGFDVISGLSWLVDLSARAMFAVDGGPASAPGTRVRDLRLNGAPLEDDRPVVLVTNSHRLGGGGAYPGIDAAHVLPVPDRDVRDLVEAFVAARARVPAATGSAFRFRPLGGVAAEFIVPATALPRAPCALIPGEIRRDGFQRVRMSL